MLLRQTSKLSPEPSKKKENTLLLFRQPLGSYITHTEEMRHAFMCDLLTVSLKLSESQRFLSTATTEEGGLSRSSNASIRMKSNTTSKKFIHTTYKEDHNTQYKYAPLPTECSHVGVFDAFFNATPRSFLLLFTLFSPLLLSPHPLFTKCVYKKKPTNLSMFTKKESEAAGRNNSMWSRSFKKTYFRPSHKILNFC